MKIQALHRWLRTVIDSTPRVFIPMCKELRIVPLDRHYFIGSR